MKYTKKQTFDSWPQFADRVTTKSLAGKWYFRGGLPTWDLETSIERAFKDWHLPLQDMPRTEKVLRHDFMRAYQDSSSAKAPEPEDTLGWLSLMQHFGAPTRLLDWTYSPFVAAYFAMEALLSDRHSREAVVWALFAEPFDRPANLVQNPEMLDSLEHFRRHRDGASFEAVFMQDQPAERFVYPVNPAKLDQRLVIQQGVHLCPANLMCSLEDNLSATVGALHGFQLFKFLLPRTILQDSMTALQRMNMQPATLFPGLDGYARQFRSRIDFYCSGTLFSETDI